MLDFLLLRLYLTIVDRLKFIFTGLNNSLTKDENEDTPLMLAIRTYKKISTLQALEQDCNSLEFMVTTLRSLESQEHPVSLEIIKALIKYGMF